MRSSKHAHTHTVAMASKRSKKARKAVPEEGSKPAAVDTEFVASLRADLADLASLGEAISRYIIEQSVEPLVAWHKKHESRAWRLSSLARSSFHRTEFLPDSVRMVFLVDVYEEARKWVWLPWMERKYGIAAPDSLEHVVSLAISERAARIERNASFGRAVDTH